jgi:hypothetical protein
LEWSIFLSDGERDSNASLDSENVVRRAGQLRVPTHIAVEVDMVNSLEVLRKMLPHSVEGDLVHEAVI